MCASVFRLFGGRAMIWWIVAGAICVFLVTAAVMIRVRGVEGVAEICCLYTDVDITTGRVRQTRYFFGFR